MNLIKPLLISKATLHPMRHSPRFTCVGIFEHAINLQSKEGRLLTLHRYNQGLSPFGWLLRPDDFDFIQSVIRINDHLKGSATGLSHQHFSISTVARTISCTIPPQPKVFPLASWLEPILLQYKGFTGIFGSFKQILSQPISGELFDIQQCYINWLQHKTVNWEPYIGKGSGLTPSHDDTLIGMLFTSFFDPRVRITCLNQAQCDTPFMPEATLRQLPHLTTYVSVAYYHAALKGEFSLPLLHLAHAVSSKNLPKTIFYVHKVAQLGHTSGLDTLLGIWLAANCVRQML